MPGNAEPPPARVFQAVTVDLAADGGVTGLRAAEVREDLAPGGKTASGTRTLDPSAKAGDLPISVETAYRRGDSFGTNLTQLSGKDGEIQVAVTVTNRTARTERVTYTGADGQPRTTSTVTAVPLTVIATAVMPASTVRSVSTDRAATNGIVSRTAKGDVQVQWAGVLAPPQLGAAATFRFTVDAKKFRMPELSLSVQPGLAVDFSVERLLAQTFGSQAQRVDNATISLLTGVSGRLQQIDAGLATIRADLADNTRATGQLLAGSLAQMDARFRRHVADLRALVDAAVSEIGTTAQVKFDQVDGDLLRKIQDILSGTFGIDDKGNVVPARPGASPTLFNVLEQVQATLGRTDTAAKGELANLVKEFDAQVGSPDQCPNTATPSLRCSLASSRAELTSFLADVAAANTALTGQVNGNGLGEVRTAYDAVKTAAADLRALAHDLQGLGGIGSQPKLGAVADALSLAVEQTSLSGTGTARDQVEKIGDDATTKAADVDTALGQLAALADKACAIPTDKDLLALMPNGGDPKPFLDALAAKIQELRTSIDGASCDPNGQPGSASETPLKDRLVADRQAWTEVASSAASTAALLDDVHTKAAAALAVLDDVLADVNGKHTPSLREKVDALVQAADQLSADANAPDGNQLVQALGAALQVTEGKQADLLQGIQDFTARVAKGAADADSRLASADTQVDAQRRSTIDVVDGLAGKLSLDLNAAGDSTMTTGRDGLTRASADLAGSRAGFKKGLDAGLAQIRQTLATEQQVNEGALAATSADLQAQIARVTADLGSAGSTTRPGTGLLGAIGTNAGEVDARAVDVAATASLTSDYRGVRRVAVSGRSLLAAQVQRSLDRAATFPLFDGQVGDGSRTTTVFIFHLPTIG